MTQATSTDRGHSQVYDMFIPVLTVVSLANMLVMLLSLDDAAIDLLVCSHSSSKDNRRTPGSPPERMHSGIRL